MKDWLVKYTDIDGEEVEGTWWFHMSQADAVRLNMMAEGGDLREVLKEIAKDTNGKRVLANFDMLVKHSVGIRDGKRFIRNQEIVDEFVQTGAYDKIFMDLVTNAEFAAEFVNGLLPANMAALMADDNLASNYTEEQLLNMDDDEFDAVAGDNETSWSQALLIIAMKRRNRRPSKAAA